MNRLSIRSSVVTILVAAVVGASIPVAFLTRQVAGEIDSEIAGSRLQLAQLMAAQGDRLLTEAFFEIDLLAAGFPRTPAGGLADIDTSGLRVHFGRSAVFNAGVVFLDTDGLVLFAEPTHTFDPSVDAEALPAFRLAAGSTDRLVSLPYLSAPTGHVVTALSQPIFSPDGSRAGTVVGILDLTDPFISDLISPSQRLGRTGHADLVDERGLVLASTDPSHVLTAGDHPDFYIQMARLRQPFLQAVPHQPTEGEPDQSEVHVMAYAPLREAPWGVAMGASDADTYLRSHRLQRWLLIFGGASAATVLLGVWLAVRLIPDTALPKLGSDHAE